jgi:hypothetical protein
MKTFREYLEDRENIDEMNKYLAGGLAAGALATGAGASVAKADSTLDQIKALSAQVDQGLELQDQFKALKDQLDSGKTKLDFKNKMHRDFALSNPEYHPQWKKGGDNTELLRQLDGIKKNQGILNRSQEIINRR